MIRSVFTGLVWFVFFKSILFASSRELGAMSPITLNCRTVPPFCVSEIRQGHAAVVVVAVFTAFIIAYYKINSTLPLPQPGAADMGHSEGTHAAASSCLSRVRRVHVGGVVEMLGV